MSPGLRPPTTTAGSAAVSLPVTAPTFPHPRSSVGAAFVSAPHHPEGNAMGSVDLLTADNLLTAAKVAGVLIRAVVDLIGVFA